MSARARMRLEHFPKSGPGFPQGNATKQGELERVPILLIGTRSREL
jgi:hypothetical protein